MNYEGDKSQVRSFTGEEMSLHCPSKLQQVWLAMIAELLSMIFMCKPAGARTCLHKAGVSDNSLQVASPKLANYRHVSENREHLLAPYSRHLH